MGFWPLKKGGQFMVNGVLFLVMLRIWVQMIMAGDGFGFLGLKLG